MADMMNVKRRSTWELNWNRFDIVEAHYWHAVDWHGGPWSDLYAKQCRIERYYTPGIMHRGYEGLTENGKAIYDQLTVQHVPNSWRKRS
tara:strand:- start:201 stop:467 length:267 start_codon:yes stop_codon:yes gene_type:complete